MFIDVPHHQAPDPGLIERARQGDNKSIGLLFERFQQSIFRYMYYRVGERYIAEDLTSEVFVRMVRGLATYQPQESPFQSWLFQIARNLAVDYFRKSGRSEPLNDEVRDSDLLPEAALERTLTHEELRLALTRVNDEQREVIILRFVLQMPIEDVAQLIGKSTDAVKGLQRRGLQALRSVMSENRRENVIPEERKE
jgi:RNA polymerase sigma-70 factor (ECF subfamily)